MNGDAVAEITAAVKGNAKLTSVLGIALVILGVLSMMAPLVTGVAVAVLVGVLLTAAGIARAALAFKAGSFGKGVLAFLLGGLTVLCGLVMLARPLLGLASLTLVLVAYFLVDGISEIVFAFKARPMKGWVWLLLGGIVSVVLAFLIWRQWPVSGAWAIGLLVGIKLMFAGWAMIAVSAAAGSVAEEVEAAGVEAAGAEAAGAEQE